MGDHTKVRVGGRTKYSCNRCRQLCYSLAVVRNHIATRHLDLWPFQCTLCSAKFRSTKARADHLASTHGKEEVIVGGRKVLQATKEATCKHCKKEFHCRVSMLRHAKMHAVRPCPECSQLLTKKEMAPHREEAHNIPIPACGICGFKCATNSRLVNHQRTVHLKEKNVKCPDCDAMFFDIGGLRKHSVKHNAVKNFECRFCAKKFPRRKALLTHEKIHTGDKNKVCSICDERFVQKASLNYHMMKRHPDAC